MFSKYKYIYEVYRERNFTRAAEKLFISQPSLSAAVKNVEAKVGAELFERSSSGIRLTEAGEAYINAAEQIMAAENDFINKINDIYNLKTGKITIGATNYLSSYVLPKIINIFKSRYPKIDVTFIEANSNNLRKMMQSEQVDIIIDSYHETTDEYKWYPLLHERILLCVPEDNKINGKIREFQITPDSIYSGAVDLKTVPPIDLRLFKDEKFILLKSGNDMYSSAVNIFRKNGISPDIAFRVDQLNISYALVASGMGVCFATDTLFKYGKFRKNVFLYNIAEEHSTKTLYIAHKHSKYCSKAMKEFIKTAKDFFCAP